MAAAGELSAPLGQLTKLTKVELVITQVQSIAPRTGHDQITDPDIQPPAQTTDQVVQLRFGRVRWLPPQHIDQPSCQRESIYIEQEHG
jgi:hypothetical protein